MIDLHLLCPLDITLMFHTSIVLHMTGREFVGPERIELSFSPIKSREQYQRLLRTHIFDASPAARDWIPSLTDSKSAVLSYTSDMVTG